ncbi:hypothetical protein LRS06_22275 [Hymenobacter sp. J193]|uniref:hypothetical protein n=1 Tax=Hymenobacter sp. J193 TaxID=2898429 RepID=UPI0021514036|nr:hypothetical protein [Hymenobacter sp. J193]MCR5890458.1 hypothetical protein [Hymenobacter sp. J193]
MQRLLQLYRRILAFLFQQEHSSSATARYLFYGYSTKTMGVDICGFLEIANGYEGYLEQDYVWFTCLDLSSLNLLTGDVCDVLFGESKQTVPPATARGLPVPLAHRRGFPPNLAWWTAQGVQESLGNDATQMSMWGYTFLSYDEIAAIHWQDHPEAEQELAWPLGWSLLFQLMKTLDEASKHQRLVVWFEWR